MAKHNNDDNSEKELIDLLRSVLSEMFKTVHDALNSLQIALHNKEHKDNERFKKLMTALETLTNSVNANTQGQANLTTAVNAAIVQLGTPGATDAQLLSLSAAIDQNTQSDKALTDSLIAAVNPTTTPVPTP
jgi:hypothetical protein